MRNSPAFNPRRYSQAARIAEAYKGNIDYEHENGNVEGGSSDIPGSGGVTPGEAGTGDDEGE